MTDEPTYSGCANQRYGPDAVTSRDLFRWPAAQIRSASPSAAIDTPDEQRPAGRLRQPQHEHAEHEPERDAHARDHADHRAAPTPRPCRAQAVRPATRGRVRRAASRRSTAASTSSTSMSSRHMRSQPAPPQVMALADGGARHGHVVRRPGPLRSGRVGP